jgi:hypothetical protein
VTHRPVYLLSRRSVRRVLGAVWLLDAVLQAQSVMFQAGWWRTDIAGTAMGEPAGVANLILWATGVVAAHAPIWNSLFVAVQALIGIALLVGRWERAAMAVSIPWALGIWVVGEGLGMMPSGFAMLAFGAPGAVLLYPLIAVSAWPGRDSRRAATVSWLVLWVGLSVLQIPWVYSAHQVLAANFEEMPQWLTWMQGPAAAHPALLSAALAAVQVVIGASILLRRRVALAAGICVSLFYWFCFQGLGGLLAGGATDPGAAPLMVLLAVSLWPATTSAQLVRHDLPQPAPPLQGRSATIAVP